MFGRTQKIEADTLSIATTRVLSEMDVYGPDSPEYPTLMQNLERLSAIKKANPSKSIDPNTALVVAGNLFGILLIVAYEQRHVMTSKAMSFIMKSS